MASTFKKIEIVGTSDKGFSEAVESAIKEASKSVRKMSWFEVVEQRGAVKDGKVVEYQVTVRIGFKLDR